MSLTLSDMQYPMMRTFVDGGAKFFMTEETARTFDQRPFRSMLRRGWVSYRPERGFYLTSEGYDAWNQYHSRSIFRVNPNLPLTSYFDPKAYGLEDLRQRTTPRRRPTKKQNIHVMKTRRVA